MAAQTAPGPGWKKATGKGQLGCLTSINKTANSHSHKGRDTRKAGCAHRTRLEGGCTLHQLIREGLSAFKLTTKTKIPCLYERTLDTKNKKHEGGALQTGYRKTWNFLNVVRGRSGTARAQQKRDEGARLLGWSQKVPMDKHLGPS